MGRTPSTVVSELADEGFTTVIRLPWGGALPQEDWLALVRSAFADVTDQILLLLGTFDRVVLEDRLAGTTTTVSPAWQFSDVLADGVVHESVMIERDGLPSSRWELYRRQGAGGGGGLAEETAVEVRVQPGEAGPPRVASPLDDDGGSPFHLFYPTRIASGLPLLLHGYFEVDAARTGFYAGSADRNGVVLDGLARLAVQALSDLASAQAVDLLSLVERLGATTPPDDPQARGFREAVLSGLDDVAWVPLAPGGAEPRRARPRDLLLTGDPHLDDALLTTFPAEYLERRTGRRVPHPGLSASARGLLLDRRPVPEDEPWEVLGLLLRPGAASPWPAGDEDDGFRALLDLVTLLQALDRTRCEALLTDLRGDPDARLLPVPQPNGGRRLYALPAPEGGVRGRSSALVMGRVRETAVTLQPPTAMDVVFLRDALLASEADGDRAKPLGVRPFTVDTVLDRLAAVQDAEGGEVVTFLWGLLGRERGHEFGTAAGAPLAATLDPAQWFWCQPGRAGRTEGDRTTQRRQRRLADVRLPARDGTWRPAGTLAFGEDWADWVASWAPADHATALRTACHRALEQVAPEPGALLAAPEQVLALLPDLHGLEAEEADEEADDVEDGDAADAETVALRPGGRRVELDAVARQREQLAFLLRLGVWEVLPVQAHERREPQDAVRPWADLREQLEPGVDDAPWNFDAGKWGGRAHGQVRVTEDFRFRWSLEQAYPARRLAMATLLDARGGPVRAACHGRRLLPHQPRRRGRTGLDRLLDRLCLAVPAARGVRALRRCPTRSP